MVYRRTARGANRSPITHIYGGIAGPGPSERSQFTREVAKLTGPPAKQPDPDGVTGVPHVRVATGLGALCTPRTTMPVPGWSVPPALSAVVLGSSCSPRPRGLSASVGTKRGLLSRYELGEASSGGCFADLA